MKRISTAALGLVALGAAGCGDWTGTKDPHRPGVELGTFHVSAKQTMTTCGVGALGSTESWAFDVKVSRGENTVFWDNGAELIPGALASDHRAFSFETSVLVNMREGQPEGLPPCSIRRVDKASGDFDTAGPDVKGFKGALSYSFNEEPGPQSDCSDVVSGPMAVLAALPCAMMYDLDATRTDPPTGEGGGSAEGPGSADEPLE